MRLEGLLALYSLLVLGISICTEEEANYILVRLLFVSTELARSGWPPVSLHIYLLSACSALLLCITSI